MVISLTNSQQKAFDALKHGKNVFLTGGAGTGKTTLIKEFIKEVDPHCEHTLLCAPTGKAALNMSIETPEGTVTGSTVHRLFGLKAQTAPSFNGTVPKIVHAADRIIIDEISMMRIDIFDYVAETLIEENHNFFRQIENKKPIQIILVGDFYQLPPVVPTSAADGASDKEILDAKYGEDIKKAYCFQSAFWELLDIKTYELTEIVRQKGDDNFCNALNLIRRGDPDGIKYINDNYDRSPYSPDRIMLCGTNSYVNKVNAYMLGRNSNKKSTYIWDYMTQLTYVDHYLKNIQCVESLTLCEGARVICIANCGTAVNGQLGTVLSTHDDHVRVDWDNGSVTDVYEYEWEVVRQEIVKSQNNMRIERKKVLSVTQLPLKLAYAITIHKSQGETFDSVTVVPDTFETGQLYTALSRCTNVHTLRLLRPLQPSDIRCDATINDFYDSIQEQ